MTDNHYLGRSKIEDKICIQKIYCRLKLIYMDLDLIYLNHWSSITLDLDIPFLLSYDKGAYWRSFFVGLVDPWRLHGGKFSLLMLSTSFGDIHEDSRWRFLCIDVNKHVLAWYTKPRWRKSFYIDVVTRFGGIHEESRVGGFLYWGHHSLVAKLPPFDSAWIAPKMSWHSYFHLWLSLDTTKNVLASLPLTFVGWHHQNLFTSIHKH